MTRFRILKPAFPTTLLFQVRHSGKLQPVSGHRIIQITKPDGQDLRQEFISWEITLSYEKLSSFCYFLNMIMIMENTWLDNLKRERTFEKD